MANHLPPGLQHLPDPMVRFESDDDSPRIQSVNPAFEEAFDDATTVVGGELREFLGRFETEADLDVLVKGIAAGKEIDIEVQDETGVDTYHYRIRTVPADDVSAGWLFCTDVTEYKRRSSELEHRNDLLQEFAGIVSHDLRNPLDVAEARLQAARETGDDVHFEKVALAHDRMEQIIRDVLTLARQGQVIDMTGGVDLGAVIEDAWSTVETSDASLEVVDDLPSIRADPDRLQQLLENLFRNAIEHGGPPVTVRVGRVPDGFYVADDGPGIPETDRERVFEPGYSTDESTGLGLAIVKRVADAHGWHMCVTVADAGGARFEFAGIEAMNGTNA